MSKEKKISAFHIIPVLIASILSSFFAWILEKSRILSDVETPFSAAPTMEATIYNVSVFLVLVSFGSLLLFILIKLKKLSLIKLLFLSSLAISFLGIVEIYILAFSVYYKIQMMFSEDLSLIIAAVVSLATVYVIISSENEYLVALLMILYGSSAGSLFGVLLPTWTVLVVAAVLSIYDLYLVFKGPLKYLIELEKRSRIYEEGKGFSKNSLLRGAVVPFKGLYIGIGDVIFYSMMAASAFIKPGISVIRFLIVIIALLMGAYVTFKLVERRGALPALPIPMLLSVLVYALSLFLRI